MNKQPNTPSGLLLLNKPAGITSFQLVAQLRKLTNVQKIGHAGTLDPFATGLMILLVGRAYTRLSDQFLKADKIYFAKVCLGQTTDTYDKEGKILKTSALQPSKEEVEKALESFQGEVDQCPPMYSAKKVQGKKLYELARKGIEIPRALKKVKLNTLLLSYSYPYIELKVSCSSGTYIRSIAHDLGEMLKCGAFLEDLTRTSIGSFNLSEAQNLKEITDPSALHLRRSF